MPSIKKKKPSFCEVDLWSPPQDFPLGAVLLDLPETNLTAIVLRVVDRMVACDQIPAEEREAAIKALLFRHRNFKENEVLLCGISATDRPLEGLLPHHATVTPTGQNESKASLKSKLLSSYATVTGMEHGARELFTKKPSLANIFHIHAFNNTRRRSERQGLEPHDLIRGEADKEKTGPPSQNGTGNYDSQDQSKKNDVMINSSEAEATAVLVGAVDFIKKPTMAFVRLSEGIFMESLIQVTIPIKYLFILLGPFSNERDYSELGRSISTLMSNKTFHETACGAQSREQLMAGITNFFNATSNFPHSNGMHKSSVEEKCEKNPEIFRSAGTADVHTDGDRTAPRNREIKKPLPRDPLQRTKTPFRGVYEDVRLRYSMYLSDILDGLNGQTLAAAIFIYFAALSAAITFGGMYGDKMDNYIGVSETLIISSVNGLVFAFFSGQPLLIVGATGPLMVFDISLYTFCKSQGIEFLPTRFWIGVWMVVISLLVTGFELTFLIKKVSRLTEEIYATLVCAIFVFEAVKKLIQIIQQNPLRTIYSFEDKHHKQIASGVVVDGMLYNGTNVNGEPIEREELDGAHPNTALLSIILSVGTFVIAIKLKHFRNSKFLGRPIRRSLGDFGVPIAIFLMVLLDYLIKDTYTDKLTMPDGISPSNPEVRGWFINPFGIQKPYPVLYIFLAAPASFLVFFLIFLEGSICQLLLSKPERKMRKGTGFHIDVILSGFINFISGSFGAPFMSPACVRTISHTAALTVMSRAARGEAPQVEGVREQRVSALIVSVLVGLSVLLSEALNLVPIAVLLGIFLYMGIATTSGIQFLERCVLYFMPVKHHYDVPYVKQVRTMKMHAFTAIQLLMMATLWVVKQSNASLFFPFVILLFIPIRLYILPYVFTIDELHALDGMDHSKGEEEPDFFEEAHQFPFQVEDDHHHRF